MKLIVRNLDRTITEDALQRMFQDFGAIQSCTLVMDKETGLSKGFGFVEMPKIGEAKVAIAQLNNKKVGDSAMRVKKADS